MMRKIVTLCGSLRFFEKMQQTAELLEIEKGWCVLTPIAHTLERDLTPQEIALLGDIHKAKIDISNAIFVVNVDGYVGNAVKQEIEYARKKGKEVLYLENE